MFENLGMVNSILWAVAVGIIAAVIYINIQRSAISKFVCGLIDNKSFDESSAMTLASLGLKGISAYVVLSAVKNQNGIKCILDTAAVDDIASKDEAEVLLFGNKKTYKYWIKSETDIVAIKDKYNFKAFSPAQILLTVAAIIATVLIASSLFEVFDGYFNTKNKTGSEQNYETQDNESDSENNNGNEPEIPTVPSSPVVPTVPTSPTVPTTSAPTHPTVPISKVD